MERATRTPWANRTRTCQHLTTARHSFRGAQRFPRPDRGRSMTYRLSIRVFLNAALILHSPQTLPSSCPARRHKPSWLVPGSALDEYGSAITLGAEWVHIYVQFAEPHRVRLRKAPRTHLLSHGLPGIAELAEAGKIALNPITKTSSARTMNLILQLSNCVSFALAHTGLGLSLEELHRAQARAPATEPNRCRLACAITV
jgi:hypothetical protein